MSLEIKIGDRIAQIELLSRQNNIVKVKVDEKIYDIDILLVERGVYSILYNNQSHNIEFCEKGDPKKYTINTYLNSFDVEIIDAETKYIQNRKSGSDEGGENEISSPMPGKVVKILVEEGEEVKAGQTVIIVSAMKMESEYKAANDGIIKKIFVEEEETVDGGQILLAIE
ncbi:MAG: acetyl-CoA carboxylase biotin carboxyl carrier protein subunit [Bacteroidetes bacterium]|jgi:biotin carboxyl carrier protein|nr:acetyl-CoA carboxylase biotin carboxyl carrier protein subunit [Bacteroidota bacterium]MBT6687386.1 acetyl-CoA carboxylase biotin carboxyl carrier protein subunit [Bacteroidota bacterium]MBT7144863.1 acetyl-CoA carboxylase biotin carboxyl carrier protein subunit [Bacteroidota bacterium]MBT7492023.1 acetyl-CoA carboxylase biotin carboxyl carrier protein subunit [Bacteroidota bacterium]